MGKRNIAWIIKLMLWYLQFYWYWYQQEMVIEKSM